MSFTPKPIGLQLNVYEQAFDTNGNCFTTDIRPAQRFVSKSPIWNSEIRCYQHNLGARVRQACLSNFVLVKQFDQNSRVPNAIEQDDKIYIRHGKLSHNMYVLDFRNISPSVALAVAGAACCKHEY